jgi:hypothetical protein
MSLKVCNARNPEDDKGIRDCLRRNPMEGIVSLAFETEPSFFDSLSVQGNASVLVARNNNAVVGVGTRTVRPMFIEGNVQNVGYLGGLRLDEGFRKRSLVKQGFDLNRELHLIDPQEFYLTSIMEDNLLARKVFEKKRKGIPEYHFLYDLVVYTIKPTKKMQKQEIDILSGDNFSLEKILEFIYCYGSNKQYFPYFTSRDFSYPITKGLEQKDLLVAVKGNDEILGIVGKWDQSSFKQTRVVSYKEPLRTLRPFINLASPITGNPILPKEGKDLHTFYSAFNVIKNNDPFIFEQLLNELSRSNRGYSYFNLGLSSNDTLSEGVKFPCRKTVFKIYGITFEKNEDIFSHLNKKIPYLEVAML